MFELDCTCSRCYCCYKKINKFNLTAVLLLAKVYLYGVRQIPFLENALKKLMNIFTNNNLTVSNRSSDLAKRHQLCG